MGRWERMFRAAHPLDLMVTMGEVPTEDGEGIDSWALERQLSALVTGSEDECRACWARQMRLLYPGVPV